MFLAKKILTALLLPPAGPLLLLLAGLWLAACRAPGTRRWGLGLAGGAAATLLALALPAVAAGLMATLERAPAIEASQLRGVQAIVVLGGGARYGAPEFGGDTVSSTTLERVRYAARLARQSGLPLLVTGGSVYGGRAEGEMMRETLEGEFGVKVRWVEAASRDTAENATLSAPLLKAAGVQRIALLSHAWHLPRAIPLFEREGLVVVPAPTGFDAPTPTPLEHFLPNAGALRRSSMVLHEWLGRTANLLAGLT